VLSAQPEAQGSGTQALLDAHAHRLPSEQRVAFPPQRDSTVYFSLSVFTIGDSSREADALWRE